MKIGPISKNWSKIRVNRNYRERFNHQTDLDNKIVQRRHEGRTDRANKSDQHNLNINLNGTIGSLTDGSTIELDRLIRFIEEGSMIKLNSSIKLLG